MHELIDERVSIVPYNPDWPAEFYLESLRIKEALSDTFAAIEHIGSTAVPGMMAKPIVDIMIGLKNYPPSEEWVRKVCTLEYTYYGEAEVPERQHFARRGKKNFNLAVVLYPGIHWENNLKFRNFLREHPRDCREYEKVKILALNSGAAHVLAYSEFKTDFLQSIFDRMGF